MNFSSPVDIKEFVKDNASKPYFQAIIEGIQDPDTSLITYHIILNHAQNFLKSNEFTSLAFYQLPEGTFKMALRLIYCSKNAQKCLDDVDVRVILECLGKKYDLLEGYLNFEECYKRMNNFGALLGFLLPLVEPIVKQRIIWLRLSDNKLTHLPASIRCFTELQKLYLEDNLLSAIPNDIIQLKKLRHVDISNNKFLTIPKNLEHIPKVYLRNNNRDLSWSKNVLAKNIFLVESLCMM
jgi:hypothetical protein